MDLEFKDRYMILWKKYFNGAELPMIFYYTDKETRGAFVKAPTAGHQCFIGLLNKVRKGEILRFGAESFGCSGAERYLGFTKEVTRPNFEYFLSYGIEGVVEGERYKKSPEIVREVVENSPRFIAPSKYIVFCRWDMLEQADAPEVVIFFAQADVLSGLFTLAGFEETERESVIAPFAAGCGSIVLFPYLEIDRNHPRGILGMFDVSARPFVPKDTLSFSVPMKKFKHMVDDMEESFLITQSWAKVNRRIKSRQFYPS